MISSVNTSILDDVEAVPVTAIPFQSGEHESSPFPIGKFIWESTGRNWWIFPRLGLTLKLLCLRPKALKGRNSQNGPRGKQTKLGFFLP